MELSDTHKGILTLIHDLERHCIKKSDWRKLKLDFPDLEKILEELIAKDLVEYESKENIYYLAYQGFEVVEELKGLKNPKNETFKSDIEQYNDIVKIFGSPKMFQRLALIGILAFGIIGTLYFYSNPTTKKNGELENIIDPNTLETIEGQLEELMDSIQKAENSVLEPK